jgi:peptidoglycan/LPS O-acetylase OafA/YrhL
MGERLVSLDAYDRSARLAPAYLVFLPAVVGVVVFALGSSEWWSKLGGVLAACGAPLLAVQWGRSGGRGRQADLFKRWGGSPTVRLLRFGGAPNAAAVQQRHDAIARSTGVQLPTATEERADPKAADDVYETAVTALRELTRGEDFPLVLKENIAYGFRRNLWGRKRYGIGVAALVAALGLALLLASALGFDSLDRWAAITAAVFALITLVVWMLVVTEDWVREAGEAYASRLLDSALRLPSG